ncbi:glycosyltransferase family 9 protein [bacterium]|nr:glycosyltransferase family 9 protein [bacterium]
MQISNQKIKILIIRRSALGDTIHTLPLAAALREKFPNAQIDWVVESKAAQFILDNPILNNVFIINKKNNILKEFLKLIPKIRNEKYDIAIDTQQLLKSAIILGLSGAKRKIALSDGREFSGIFANEIISTNRRQFDVNYHVVNRNLEIAKYLDADSQNIKFILPEPSQNTINKTKQFLLKLNPDKKTVIISPETTWDNKHWLVQNWQDIIDFLKNKVNIIYTGTNNDNDLSEKILSKFSQDNIINLKGKTNLEELTEIFKCADLVITPDSGSAHIAWATGIPAIITLFFATSAKRTAPFGSKYYSVQANCTCSPCMKKKCKYNGIHQNKCISSINSKEIIKIVNKVLQFE